MSDPYAGTGGTSGTLEQQSEGWQFVSGGAKGGASTALDSDWWGVDDVGHWMANTAEKAGAAYAKSDLSASVDSGLAKVKAANEKIAASANAWLGFASDPEKIANVLNMATIIVVVLGVVYVVAVFAPVIGALVK